MRRVTVEGFVIVQPADPPYVLTHTFGRTMSEAWIRHIGYRAFSPGELATLKGRWVEKGYRPVPTTLAVDIPPRAGIEESTK